MGIKWGCAWCHCTVMSDSPSAVRVITAQMTQYYHKLCYDKVIELDYPSGVAPTKFVLCPWCEQEITKDTQTVESSWRTDDGSVSHYYHTACFKLHCNRMYKDVVTEIV